MSPPIPLGTIILITSLFSFTVTSQLQSNRCYDRYGNYSTGTSFASNLNALLPSLSAGIGNTAFYNATVGQAHAIALCSADIQLSECRGCIANIANETARLCPNRLQALMWSEYCMVRYSNESMLGVASSNPDWILYNAANVSTQPDRFREVRSELMGALRAEAANGGSLRKVAVGNRTDPDFPRPVFAMVQCTPDLSPDQCTRCLVEADRYITGSFDVARGARVYTPSCFIRHETDYSFYNVTRLQEALVPAPPPAAGGRSDDSGSRRSVIIIVISVVVFLILIAFPVGIFVRKRIKIRTENVLVSDNVDGISTVESIQYDFAKIRAATDGFSDANKLGQGGFGAVYKGRLDNGREIAVKRLSIDSGQGDLEFKNEVLLVTKLQHRNLVRIFGFSQEGVERLLIYEFVPNGSLDRFLYDPIQSSNLDWVKRRKIIGGLARGLLYLHEDSRLRIIHRDLKAGNVLLDEDMNAKISDFGLAKLVVRDETHESTSRIVGTYGYMAPEYAFQGQFSAKSDVYSFGVLVLEILSGQRKAFLRNGQSLGDLMSYAWRSWREKTSENIIDPILRANCGTQPDMLRCIHIALLCVQEDAADRPTMASVVLMLNSFSLTLPMPSEPGFYAPTNISESSVSHEYNSSRQHGNDSLITEVHPR